MCLRIFTTPFLWSLSLPTRSLSLTYRMVRGLSHYLLEIGLFAVIWIIAHELTLLNSVYRRLHTLRNYSIEHLRWILRAALGETYDLYLSDPVRFTIFVLILLTRIYARLYWIYRSLHRRLGFQRPPPDIDRAGNGNNPNLPNGSAHMIT